MRQVQQFGAASRGRGRGTAGQATVRALRTCPFPVVSHQELWWEGAGLSGPQWQEVKSLRLQVPVADKEVLLTPSLSTAPSNATTSPGVLATAVEVNRGVTACTGVWRWDAVCVEDILDTPWSCLHQVLHWHGLAQAVRLAGTRAASQGWRHQGVQLQAHMSPPGAFLLSRRPAVAVGAALWLLARSARPKLKVLPKTSTLHLHS